jgi:PKD repeat protein
VANPITTPVFDTPGNYTFTATLSDGTCSFSDDVVVEVPVPVTPVADFTVNSTTQTTGGVVSTAIFTDLSTNYPSAWAWNITGPGAVTYVDATSNASQNPHVQFGAAGHYTVELTASNLAGSDTETKTDYILVILGYCQSQASSTADEEIYSVTVNGATNAYDCFTVAPGPGSILNRYSNFATLGSLTSMDKGATIDFTVEENECDAGTFYYFGTAIWIDYNQDGIFTEPDEVAFKETATAQGPRNVIGTFTIPGTALTGETRMRITVAEGYSGTGLTPCLGYSFGETEDYVVTITAPTYYTLNLTLFLEGLYTGAGTMHEALNDLFEPQWGLGVADQVTVELHNDLNYATLEWSSGPVNLSTIGNVVLNTIPASLNGNYWITVINRNHILTVSSVPYPCSNTTYDFSTAASQAYGDNQKDMLDGYFAIWGGDVNQDYIVDSGDMNPVDNDATLVIFVGYAPSDVNGDGLADSGDMNIVDNNATAIIMAWTP